MLPPIELRIALVKSIFIAFPNVLIDNVDDDVDDKKIPRGVFNP